MKFIKIDQESSKDYVRTEDIICNLIKNDERSLQIDLEYAEFNWADSINKKGIPYTQNIVNSIQSQSSNSEKIIYVCQHISVDKIMWGSENVFTPHATLKNGFKSIPHHAINASATIKEFSQRKYICSFMGSFETHPCRSSSCHTISQRSDCFVKDTGGWHFYSRDEHKEVEYKSVLSDSCISLCPRGTGPSTIRFWESIATGCIPLVICDDIIFPLSNIVDWRKHLIVIPTWHSPLVENIVENISKDKLARKSKEIKKIYEKYFSNNNLHVSILKSL